MVGLRRILRARVGGVVARRGGGGRALCSIGRFWLRRRVGGTSFGLVLVECEGVSASFGRLEVGWWMWRDENSHEWGLGGCEIGRWLFQCVLSARLGTD